LSVIIGRDVADTITLYLRAMRYSRVEALSVNERELRWGIERLTSRIQAIVEQQAKRDIDEVRRQRGFIQARHPAATGGDLDVD
ncbi:MAG TPA: hypothetical protein VF637_15660, partial [Sphingomicrobium sp.]